MVNRIISAVLCLLLLLPLAAQVHAAGAVAGETDTYVLNNQVDGDGYEGPELQYFSPYRIEAYMNSNLITMKNCIFALYNTTNNQVIPTYCSDISVLVNPDYTYRRINLEDSTFAASASNKIRAIVMNGFYLSPIPGESEAEHEVRVDQELQRLGDAAGVEDLTIGEAITGTQSAIWEAAHGNSLSFRDFVHSIYTTDVSNSVRYYDICNEERINGHTEYTGSGDRVKLATANDRWIGSRIEAVYDYLLSLDPVPPSASSVSADSFKQVQEPVITYNPDGTADITVTTTVDVYMEAGDQLTLTASVDGSYRSSASLNNGTQTVTLTLSGVPGDQLDKEIELTIAGLQSGSDVYLFDANGGRETSQSMVGMDESRLPVEGTVTLKPNVRHQDRIINFYKTSMVATGTDTYDRVPLEGITFDIYFTAELNDYLTGRVQLPEAEDYVLPEAADFTLVTDESGRASINLTQHGMPDGVYLVVEREHPAIEAPVKPFYVTMPSTNPEGTGHVYEVTVQPKNDVKGGLRIEKDVISLGNDSASVDAYADHTWIIGTNIPDDIANGKSFVISDTLDPRLDYTGNVKVNVETADGQSVLVTLTEGEHYNLNVTDVDSLAADKPADAFTVTLTRTGMSEISAAVGEGSFDEYMLRVYFDARINANAGMGEEIPNQATVKYTNSVSFDFEAESDEPVVFTGGIGLLKVDASNGVTTLPGAEFEVYRYATADEVAAGGDAITHIPGVSGAVVKVSFFDNEALTGSKVTSAVSDTNGEVTIYGLAYGEYFLLETRAPEGYHLLEEAVKLPIDGTTHTEEKRLTVENHNGSTLPSTGGIGTTVYTATGLTLLAAAGMLLLKKRRSFC